MEKAPPLTAEQYGRKWDKCAMQVMIKSGGGLLLGITASMLFFKKKSWPMFYGGGFGLGMAFSDCLHDLRAPFVLVEEDPCAVYLESRKNAK